MGGLLAAALADTIVVLRHPNTFKNVQTESVGILLVGYIRMHGYMGRQLLMIGAHAQEGCAVVFVCVCVCY